VALERVFARGETADDAGEQDETAFGRQSISNGIAVLLAGCLCHRRILGPTKSGRQITSRVDRSLAVPGTSQHRHRLARRVYDVGVEGNGELVTHSGSQDSGCDTR